MTLLQPMAGEEEGILSEWGSPFCFTMYIISHSIVQGRILYYIKVSIKIMVFAQVAQTHSEIQQRCSCFLA
jgi:hypothetical protein